MKIAAFNFIRRTLILIREGLITLSNAPNDLYTSLGALTND